MDTKKSKKKEKLSYDDMADKAAMEDMGDKSFLEPPPEKKKSGGAMKYAHGGKIDGCAIRGKTRGKTV